MSGAESKPSMAAQCSPCLWGSAPPSPVLLGGEIPGELHWIGDCLTLLWVGMILAPYALYFSILSGLMHYPGAHFLGAQLFSTHQSVDDSALTGGDQIQGPYPQTYLGI